MHRINAVGLALVVMLVAVGAAPTGAAVEIQACSLVTAAELEAALRQKVTVPGFDASATYTEGSLKGVTEFFCGWWLGGPVLGEGSTYVTVKAVSRPPRTPEEMGLLSYARGSEDTWKKEGVTVEVVKIAGGDCRAYKLSKPMTLCYVEAKGRALFVQVMAPTSAPIALVKALIEKAASRLP